jgi:hypothetical protein
MRVGAAQIEITPKPGLDLAGFAVRPQPSTGVLDSLWLRAVYFEDKSERLLWLHADLLAFAPALAESLRRSIQERWGIPYSRILVVTTHTHSGPATIQLTGCGKVDADYVRSLQARCHEAVRLALANAECCHLVTAEGRCELGVNRRNPADPCLDPRVGGLGWRCADGTFKAVLLCYTMHPVCLRGSEISADWPGEAARTLASSLPGCPVVLVSCGACGDINPPEVGVTAAQMRRWGKQVAESVQHQLLAAQPKDSGESLRVGFTAVTLPVQDETQQQVEDYAAACLGDLAGRREFGDTFPLAVETWRRTMLERLAGDGPQKLDAELGLIGFGHTSVVTVNAEMFSRFNELACNGANGPAYTVGCANGMIGYVAPVEAYDEGGYEVLWSMLFYNVPRLRKGSLESLAHRALQLLSSRKTPTA